jgi:hypothetical protein
MPENDSFGKRSWVKLWVGEWLDGTTRYEMTGAQRAFFMDLLAMAGRSRQPGVICAGQSSGRIIGYPLSVFQALDSQGELDILATLQLFETCGKVRVEVMQEMPKFLKIEILNWRKYQSNLDKQAERSRKYRKKKRDASRPRHGQKSRGVTGVEVDVEVEEEKTVRASHAVEPAAPRDGVSSQADVHLQGFEEFWSLYPLKKAKQQASRAWGRVKASEVPAIIKGVRSAIRTEQWLKDGGKYVPHAATFLNGRRWEDETSASDLPAPTSGQMITVRDIQPRRAR